MIPGFKIQYPINRITPLVSILLSFEIVARYLSQHFEDIAKLIIASLISIGSQLLIKFLEKILFKSKFSHHGESKKDGQTRNRIYSKWFSRKPKRGN